MMDNKDSLGIIYIGIWILLILSLFIGLNTSFWFAFTGCVVILIIDKIPIPKKYIVGKISMIKRSEG